MIQNWQAKYFEKTFKESHVNIFRSLEIENYLTQLLRKKGYTLHSYRINFSNAVIQIFVSAYKKTLPANKKQIVYKTKKKESLNKIKSENILKTINYFTNNRFHINLKILNLNNHVEIKNNSGGLSRFKASRIEQLYPIVANQHGSASLLGTFIAEYLRTTKRHNFFFGSLKKNLNSVLKQQNYRLKGIKILIKGRLNNATRSQNKYIKIGSSPLITKSQNIDYYESTAYTPNGTIGVKVWVCYKKTANYSDKTEASALKAGIKNF